MPVTKRRKPRTIAPGTNLGGRPPRIPGERLAGTVYARLTRAQLTAVETYAASQGLTVSELMRLRLADIIGVLPR